MATTFQIATLGRRDRNINTPVGAFNNTRKNSEMSRWICIYPAYLNSKKSLSEGRKIALAKAVENPTCGEIRDVLVNAGFKLAVENKVHPRELNKFEMLYKGRVRLQLKNDDNTPCLPNFPTSLCLVFKFLKLCFVGFFILGDAVLDYVAETIPKLKTRHSASAGASGAQSSQEKSSKKKH